MSERSPQQPCALARAEGWRLCSLDRHYAGLVLLFLVEALAFYSQLADRITPYHPIYHDQVGYMVQTYELIDNFQRQGWPALFAPILHPASATGVTFTVQGALLMLFGGVNRTAMLSLNLIYLVAVQLALFNTVRTRLRSVELAWIATALLLSLGTLFNLAGGIFDYRIDFSAMCLYGIWTCLVIRSERFRELKTALLIAAVGGCLIALRFFTIAYLGLVFGGLLVALLLGVWLAATPPARQAATSRARNLLVSGALTAALAGPLLFAVRRQLYNYYGIGHFLGSEKYIRAAESQVYTLSDHLLYYPNTLLFLHMGPLALWLVAAITAASLVFGLLLGWVSFVERMRRIGQYGFDLLALALTITVPLALLTIDVSKSPVVGGIVVVPVILLVAMLSASLWPYRDVTVSPANRLPAPGRAALAGFGPDMGAVFLYGARSLCVIVLVLGFAGFLGNASNEPREPSRVDRERIVALNESIARYVVDNRMNKPKVSFDRVVDYLNQGTLALYGYERFRRMIDFIPRFGHGEYGIFATPRDVAMKLIMDSDIVVLTDPLLGRGHPYPMNTKIREYWDELWRWTSDNLILLQVSNIAGIPHHIFAKPGIKVDGASGEWISSAGLLIDVDTVNLTRWPIIVLEGPATESDFVVLGGRPQPHAILVDNSNQRQLELPVVLKFTGQAYSVVIDARALAGAAGERKQIRLTFDRHFVPSRLWPTPDTRELVLRTPLIRNLLAAPLD